ncbi:MAG: histidine kinase [Niabella sp.]
MHRRGLVILTHIGSWLLFSILMAAFLYNGGRGNGNWLQTIFSPSFLLFVLFYVLVFYLNLYVLMSCLFLTKKYTVYILISLGLFAVCLYIKPFEQVMQHSQRNLSTRLRTNDMNSRSFLPPSAPDMKNRPAPFPNARMNRPPRADKKLNLDIISLILFLMAMTGSAMLVLSKQWRVTEKKKSLIEIQKIQAELAFLKSQISPHFLFNTLNNIYALAITKSEHTAAGILRLSNIMRYVTDKAKEDFVPIEKEIACINDFIELQKLRLGKMVTLDYTLTGEYGHVKIAPLILVAFIENAFKHGISNDMSSYISIAIQVNEAHTSLRTQNSLFKANKNHNRDGIGLLNARQRLELLYPDAHKLQISEGDGKFTVVLELDNTQIQHSKLWR